MKKTKTLLAASVLAIICGLVVTFTTCMAMAALAQTGDLIGFLGSIGVPVGPYIFAIIVELAFGVLGFVAGVLGFASENKELLMRFGRILIFLKVLDIIACILVGVLDIWSIAGIVVSILYYSGAARSEVTE